MAKIDNYVSKLLYKDDSNSYTILTYIDLNEVLSSEFMFNYVKEITEKNPILKKYFFEKNNEIFLEYDTTFNIKEYYTIENTRSEQFDEYMYDMLNSEFDKKIKWKFLWLIDENTKKTRVYFKIHHSYLDGENLISMLVSPFKTNDNSNKFKRNTTFLNTLYYYLIGTILLIITNVKIIFGIFIQTIYKNNEPILPEKSVSDTNYIICKPFHLNKVKCFTKKNNITINDFLYSLIIKTDKLYRKKEKKIITLSPCYIPSSSETINVCPIFIEMNNSHDNSTLLKKVNETFNSFKYSLFIPLFSFVLNQITSFLNINTLIFLYKYFLNKIDYTLTNIIGPSIEELNENYKIKISDVRFLIASKSNEVIYNIVSSGNNINIICSFKKGVIKNKKRFEKCIYKAYKQLIKNNL